MNEDFEKLLGDSKNWKSWKGVAKFYYSTEDSRAIVPKPRRWMGWTINFAHQLAYRILALAFLIAVLPVAIIISLGALSLLAILGAISLSISILILLALYFSKPSR
jgi:uncharacterized membrane protein